MKCFYYLSPSLASTEQISTDLHAAGINDFYIHVISKDESGLRKQHVHSSNYLETLDVIRVGFIGAFLGFVAGLIGVELLRYFEPFGPGVPNMVYGALVVVGTLFGAWEGGLIGIGSENKKLERFHDDIEAGRFVILIYARRQLEEKVRAMMAENHREAEFVGVDRYFMNPFSRIKRQSDDGARSAKLLQKG
jgi:hypothetical protein